VHVGGNPAALEASRRRLMEFLGSVTAAAPHS